MDLKIYVGFMLITVLGIVFILRAFFYALIIRIDPLKAILPNIARWAHLFEHQKKINKDMGNLS
jgi:hypothetical protein